MYVAMTFSRRQFLRATVAVAGVAAVGALPSCRGVDDDAILEHFPLGVASGDPSPTHILLWTYVEAEGEVEVGWELATDTGFSNVISSGEVSATAETAHTVRVRVTGLQADTVYYYRFAVGRIPSHEGRTRTAPKPDADVPVRFAWASCQDYPGRWYHCWRALLEEDDVDFVLFTGDYIYETIADARYQDPVAKRSLTLPDGFSLDGDPQNLAAETLADYRALYRQIRSDPDLREVHRRYPFVIVWDDHEFANDCWQDHSVDFNEADGPERRTERREAATRAWFEFLPVDVERDDSKGFPNDIVVYRAFRWGRNLELFLLDVRYYRDDHLIPEGPIDVAVGKIMENSPLGSRTFVIKDAFDPREAAAQPSMLGDAQMSWVIEAMNATDATWKGLVSPLPMAQLALDFTELDIVATFQRLFYFKTDIWDGFRSERRDLLEALADLPGLVVLSGDLHGSYAADVHLDYDDPTDPVIAPEFTVSSISSATVMDQLSRIIAGEELLAAMGFGELVPLFDDILKATNAHVRYANSNAFGIAIAELDSDELRVEMLEIDEIHQPIYPGISRRIAFRVGFGKRSMELL
jgi:alkaline phosphatase D